MKFRALLATLLALVVSLFIAAPAMAYPSDCSNSAYICFYTSTSPSGGYAQRDAPSVWSKSICYSASAGSIIGRTGYISNPTASSFVVYTDSYCLDNPGPIYAHSSGAMNSTYNARIRSYFRAS